MKKFFKVSHHPDIETVVNLVEAQNELPAVAKESLQQLIELDIDELPVEKEEAMQVWVQHLLSAGIFLEALLSSMIEEDSVSLGSLNVDKLEGILTEEEDELELGK